MRIQVSSFVQKKDFYTAQNIKVLTPKKPMCNMTKMFYCYAIEHNRFRYTSHGREANKTLNNLLLPSLNSVPDWVNNTTITTPSNGSLINKKHNLDVKNWQYFNLNSMFAITGSKSFTKTTISKYGLGKYPYVVTSSENNGVQGFYNHYTERGNVLTIDSATVGSCFYQKNNFSASDHVEKLTPKFNMNVYIALFLQTVINLEKVRYGYGRKFAQMRIEKTRIKLPTKNNQPDWQFMEDYIKSLPYSSNL